MTASGEAVPESAVTGMVWPALPGPQHLNAFAVLFQIEQSQWWSAAEIRASQLRQAAALIAHAASEVPFYRERFAGLVAPGADSVNEEAWYRIPVLTRAEVQEAGEALNARSLPAGHGARNDVTTSGSTGRPVRIQSTELAAHFRTAIRLRGNLWHRRDYDGKVCAIQRLSDAHRRLMDGGQRLGWASGYATGPIVYRDVAGPADDHLAWLAAEEPDYLITYPTTARVFAQRALERGVRLQRLKEVDTMGEVLDTDVRDLVRRAFGVPVADIYSAREIGVLAIQCPEAEHYHVQAEAVLVEIVDDAGQACPPGAVGRVVVTPLHNFATPLIRYHVGDYAEAGADCACGRGLPVIRRVMGRTRNMVRLPNGVRAFPALDGKALAQVAPLRQIQLVQKSASEIEAKLVATRPLNAAETVRLGAAVGRMLGHPFPLRLVYVEEIARAPSGKYEDFRCELDS